MRSRRPAGLRDSRPGPGSERRGGTAPAHTTARAPARRTPARGRRRSGRARTWPACAPPGRGACLRAQCSFGTPSSLGSWLIANTARFRTSTSGSSSTAPASVPTARSPAFWATQKRAWPRTREEASCRARSTRRSMPASPVSVSTNVRCSRNALVAVGAGQPIDDLGARSAARGAQPERGIAPDAWTRSPAPRTPRARDRPRGRPSARSPRARRFSPDPARARHARAAALRRVTPHDLLEQRHAVGGTHTVDPVDRAGACLHRAARVRKRHAIDDPAVQPREHDERRGVVTRRAPVLEVAIVVEHAPGSVSLPIALRASRIDARDRATAGTVHASQAVARSRAAIAATTGCKPAAASRRSSRVDRTGSASADCGPGASDCEAGACALANGEAPTGARRAPGEPAERHAHAVDARDDETPDVHFSSSSM